MTKVYKLVNSRQYNPGDQKLTEAEITCDDIKFKVYKNNNRTRPTDKNNILFIGCFSEFGCEIVGCLYCVPHLVRQNPGKYVIAVGWYGREYLYRHLVDEFWEIDESHMGLREYARAFHNTSRNIFRLENKLQEMGHVVKSASLGVMVVATQCLDCKHAWGSINRVAECPNCKSKNINQSLYADVKNKKSTAYKIPKPSKESQDFVKQWLGPNPVGVFARGRKCYGRNLQPEFYEKLIRQLQAQGYTPIWLGEKQTTQPCPVEGIIDFSRMPESRELELTLAIISQLKFTIQFWTASSRLSAIMGTPYIIVESPDQLWGNGQEGFRLNLCTMGPRKIAIAHFLNVCEDHSGGLAMIDQCVRELIEGNEEIVLGLLEDKEAVKNMIASNSERIGT